MTEDEEEEALLTRCGWEGPSAELTLSAKSRAVRSAACSPPLPPQQVGEPTGTHVVSTRGLQMSSRAPLFVAALLALSPGGRPEEAIAECPTTQDGVCDERLSGGCAPLSDSEDCLLSEGAAARVGRIGGVDLECANPLTELREVICCSSSQLPGYVRSDATAATIGACADLWFSTEFQCAGARQPCRAPNGIQLSADGACDEPGGAYTPHCWLGADSQDCCEDMAPRWQGADPSGNPLDAEGLCCGDTCVSCLSTEDGVCDEESGECPPGSDVADCHECGFVDDGFCDEVSGLCMRGQDTLDCCENGVPRLTHPNSTNTSITLGVNVTMNASVTIDPGSVCCDGNCMHCPTQRDGVCDETSGACPLGSDPTDCLACRHANDGVCDEPGGYFTTVCYRGTDNADCCHEGASRNLPEDPMGNRIRPSGVCCDAECSRCASTADGFCDEGSLCPPGSDTEDCCEGGQLRQDLRNAAGQLISTDQVCCTLEPQCVERTTHQAAVDLCVADNARLCSVAELQCTEPGLQPLQCTSTTSTTARFWTRDACTFCDSDSRSGCTFQTGALSHNSVCDLACNRSECGWDGGDCDPTLVHAPPLPAPSPATSPAAHSGAKAATVDGWLTMTQNPLQLLYVVYGLRVLAGLAC